MASSAYDTEGGAIYSDDPASYSNDTFTSNVATATGATGSSAYAYGGAIDNEDGLDAAIEQLIHVEQSLDQRRRIKNMPMAVLFTTTARAA